MARWLWAMVLLVHAAGVEARPHLTRVQGHYLSGQPVNEELALRSSLLLLQTRGICRMLISWEQYVHRYSFAFIAAVDVWRELTRQKFCEDGKPRSHESIV